MTPTDDLLGSWNDGAATAAIRDFVARVTTESSPGFLAPQERVAVFDNDGTLWCEKPMPIQVGFILRRLAEMAARDPSLRARQPWKAAYDEDYGWLGATVAKHYQGDDGDLKVLVGGYLRAFEGMDVEDYEADVTAFLRDGTHPTLGRPYLACGYRPMAELLRFLEANGFTIYIASGGDRDFMRPTSMELYGIPRERVVGSTLALAYQEDEGVGAVMYKAEMELFDDGPQKPVRIWSRIGRRPVLAAGNSNGDIQMLQFTGGPSRPSLRLLLLHDDPDREFDYTTGAEQALERARAHGWTIVSIRNDWATVFDDTTTPVTTAE